MRLNKFSEHPKNLFGYLFWNVLFCWAPFGIAMGILSLLGQIPVNVNGEATYGLKGLLVILITIPLIAFFLALIVWIYLRIGNFFLRAYVRIFEK